MHAFGLSRELCVEFLRKQCIIANLREGQPNYVIFFSPVCVLRNVIRASVIAVWQQKNIIQFLFESL